MCVNPHGNQRSVGLKLSSAAFRLMLNLTRVTGLVKIMK